MFLFCPLGVCSLFCLRPFSTFCLSVLLLISQQLFDLRVQVGPFGHNAYSRVQLGLLGLRIVALKKKSTHLWLRGTYLELDCAGSIPRSE